MLNQFINKKTGGRTGALPLIPGKSPAETYEYYHNLGWEADSYTHDDLFIKPLASKDEPKENKKKTADTLAVKTKDGDENKPKSTSEKEVKGDELFIGNNELDDDYDYD